MRKSFLRRIGVGVCLLIVLTVTLCGCIGKLPNAFKKIDYESMELVFEDEFEGTQLNQTYWSTEKYWDHDHDYIRHGGYWDAGQISLDGEGFLHITTEYLEDGPHGAGYYTAQLNTRGKVEYGKPEDGKGHYFEVRCKAPKAQGMWSAFWLLCDSYDDVTEGGRNGAEIDVFESPYFYDKTTGLNYKSTAFHTLHVDGYSDDHKGLQSPYYHVGDLYDTFHTYGVYWDDKTYVFYIDGKETWRTKWNGTPAVDEYMILSCEISGRMEGTGEDARPNPSNPNNIYKWGGQITDNDKDALPADFAVDYVRVYRTK